MIGSNKHFDNLDGRSTLLEVEHYGMDNISLEGSGVLQFGRRTTLQFAMAD